MWSTRPGRSAATVTPCTAATLPMASSVSGHASRRATTVVTASGGGVQSCDIAVLICEYLKPASTAITAMTTTNIAIILFAMATTLNVEAFRSIPQNGLSSADGP